MRNSPFAVAGLFPNYGLRRHLASKRLRGAEGLLVTNMVNVRYLTGFSGSSGFLLISAKEAVFATDFRYQEQAKNEVTDCEISIIKDKMGAIKKLSRKLSIASLGVESGISWEQYDKLRRAGLRPKPIKSAVEKARQIKDGHEIILIKEAVRRAEGAFRRVLPRVKAGVTEISIALRLEGEVKKSGSNRLPFDIIVASGANGAMPHARASDKRLAPGDLIVIDWGAEAGGYFSDITRTLLVKGGPNAAKSRGIYETVLRANRAATASVRPGASMREIDKSARDVIKKAGWAESFGHGTGHGVGLDVHELPSVSYKSGVKAAEGMVFTIEPGIYVPGFGGVRIEDMAYVTESGAQVLTSLPAGLRVV